MYKIGYVSRYYSEELAKIMKKGLMYEAYITHINMESKINDESISIKVNFKKQKKVGMVKMNLVYLLKFIYRIWIFFEVIKNKNKIQIYKGRYQVVTVFYIRQEKQNNKIQKIDNQII